MYSYKFASFGAVLIGLFVSACTTPKLTEKTVNTNLPAVFHEGGDTTNTATVNWRAFFSDPYLIALIDTALENNQELNIVRQEIMIAANEIRASKGEYLPFVDLRAGAGVEKSGRYTVRGANEATTDIEPGKEIPEPVGDYMLSAVAHWEVDVWRKLRNARKAAVKRYLASVEGQNFLVTTLVAEIANSYFELLALDNQLAIVQQNITIQQNALDIVRMQKDAARVTELAVRKFEAEVLNTRSLQYDIQQQIVETENRINFLVGRYPQPVERNAATFTDLVPGIVHAGVPSQLLTNRPDIRRAEQELAAAKLDVAVARANFYPSVGINAGVGLQAFKPSYLMKTPESMFYSLAGDLIAPLVNRNAIKAMYSSANARQVQAVYEYERTVLNAFIDVMNQLSWIDNLEQSYSLKSQQVDALTESVNISNNLFRSARADYMEVLLTQRDALESKFELVETKKKQMNAVVNVYQALGGGWE